jgi:hypothetical protein
LDWYLEQVGARFRKDTVETLWYLRYAKKAGVLAKRLHNYRQHSAMASKTDVEARLANNEIMPAVYRDYLIDKAGVVSEENERYINEVYERSFRNTKGENT